MRFQKLKVWQDSFDLVVKVYSLLTNCRDYGFCDQIRRASISIPSNIAEGIERGSDKDSIRFLYYAKGSTGEVLTQTLLGVRLGYINENEGKSIEKKCIVISKMLMGLIKHRKAKLAP